MTVRRNRLGDRASVYLSDNLRQIPPHERWNLVVSNPPHFDDDVFADEIRLYDRGWRLHRDFFADVSRFLAPGGVIVLQENNQGSTTETFRPMIETAGFRIVLAEGCRGRVTEQPNYYYIGAMRAGDDSPSWIRS
jgi:methylase of polypeptide subunit release factors